MNRAHLLLTFVSLGFAASLQAQLTPVPSVPSPAPKPGLTNETFASVVLSPTPAPGQSVPGWYPLPGEEYNGMELVLGERAPTTFAADEGVLRFADSNYNGNSTGRVRQLPDGTSEICVDLFFYEGAVDYAQYGLFANIEEQGYPLYGITVGSNYVVSAEHDGETAEVVPARTYYISGPGFMEQFSESLANQWLRLSMEVDASGQTLTVKVNGSILFSGYPKIRRSGTPKFIEEPSGPLPLFTNAALVGGGGPASEPEPQNGPEESAILIEAFFDNFSHNGNVAAPDLTVGPTRAAASRVGDGVLGRDPARQSLNLDAKYDETPTAFFGLGNEGGAPALLSLRGSVAGAAKIRVVNFLLQSGKKTNITGALRTGSAEVSLSGNEGVVISSEAALKPKFRALMSRLRGRYSSGGQSLFVSSSASDAVLDAAGATFRFESAIPSERTDRDR